MKVWKDVVRQMLVGTLALLALTCAVCTPGVVIMWFSVDQGVFSISEFIGMSYAVGLSIWAAVGICYVVGCLVLGDRG